LRWRGQRRARRRRRRRHRCRVGHRERGGAPCPFTAAQASDLIGQPLIDEGNCLFGDGKGVASLTVTMASETAGLMTYDYQRKQADDIYTQVSDIDVGGQGYLAIKDIGAEVVVVRRSGSYTMTLSSFERLGSSDGYEPVLRKLVDALPQ
jgi:hypothetical protein